MQRADIAVINQAGYPAADVTSFVTAMQTFVQWVAEAWPQVSGSTVREAPVGANLAGLWPLTLATDITVANTLGYHEYSRSGIPTGFVEKAACDEYDWPWTIAASHELAEMLINPYENYLTQIGAETYPVEIADPVTAQRGHMVGDVEISNFVTPAFFRLDNAGRLDLFGTVSEALPTIPHLGWVESSLNGQWTSSWGPSLTPAVIAFLQRKGLHRRQRIKLGMGS